MSKKKIGFVISSLSSGGAERVISNLSNVLIEKFEIVIITFVNSKPFYDLDHRIKVIHCREVYSPSKSIIQSIKLNYMLTIGIYRIFKKENIDLTIGFITSTNILTAIAAKIYGIPCIISERNNPLRGDLPRFWMLLRNLMYPKADSLVLQTKGVKKLYEKKVEEKKLIILPNPIATELTQLRDSNVRKEKLILTVGRLDENKNQSETIMAFKSLDLHDWRLLIIGDGVKKEFLKNLIKTHNLENKVEIISRVKDIHNYYNKASVFIFTSKTEGFPNALLEAMHFGIPCISTDCNFGPSDLINDGDNGFLIPIDDVNMLEERLYQLINNKELRADISTKAKLSTEKYVSDKVISKWENLINSLL